MEGTELPTEPAKMAMVGAGLPRAGPISSAELIVPHGLRGALVQVSGGGDGAE